MSAPSTRMQTVKIVGAVLIAAFAMMSAGCLKQPAAPSPIVPPPVTETVVPAS
jgi:hypothetical protein